MSAFVTLAFMRKVPTWLTVIVLSRDVMLVVGYFLLFTMTQRAMEVKPSAIGKLSTFLQICSVTLVLVSLVRWNRVPPTATTICFLLTGLVTATAGLQYMVRGLRWLQRQVGGTAPG
jgi:cardiolipin synthase